MVDALKRASAGRITAAIPYFGYARQDRRPRSLAGADYGENRREHALQRRLRSRDDHGFALRPDSGFFRYSR